MRVCIRNTLIFGLIAHSTAQMTARAGCNLDRLSLLSGHFRQSKSYQFEEWITRFSRTASRLTGKPISVTGTKLRNIRAHIDMFLYIGDIDHLVHRYDDSIKRVESAFLMRERNLITIAQLKDARTEKAITQILLDANLLTEYRNQVLTEGSPEKFHPMRQKIIEHLETTNRKHERDIGKNFLQYEQVRSYLARLKSGNPAVILNAIRSVENMGHPYEHFAKRIENPDDNTYGTDRLDEAITTLAGLRGATPRKTKAGLSKIGLLSSEIETLLASQDEGTATTLATKLEVMEHRLRQAREMVRNASILDGVLGVQDHDLAHSPHLFPQTTKERPRLEDLKQLYWASKPSMQAHRRQELLNEVISLADSTVMLGFLSGYVPALAKVTGPTVNLLSFGKIDSNTARLFAYDLLSGLYNETVINQHYPALTLLRRAQGDDAKMARVLEWLSAGTKDELLNTFARRADMKDLWERIKNHVKPTEGDTLDTFSLYQRMVEAEKFRNLGFISEIDDSSRARRILVSLFYGGGVASAIYSATGTAGTPPQNDNGGADDDETDTEILTDVRDLLKAIHKTKITEEDKKRIDPIIERLIRHDKTLESRNQRP